MGSFAFSLRFSFVTVSVTVAPAGIVAPLEPTTALFTVARNLSPTLCVLVQRSEFARTASSVPAEITPERDAVPVPAVLVLPLAVFVGVDVLVDVVGRLVVGRGVVDLVAVPPEGVAGTSVSCGCAAVSCPASARSRAIAVSVAKALSVLALSPPHAAMTATAQIERSRPVYLVMRGPPGNVSKLRFVTDLGTWKDVLIVWWQLRQYKGR